jgi:serine/threonine protein kinase
LFLLTTLEHEVDFRNLERHRRDALVMERLTSAPNIVDIYGHCGNTVVTEHAPHGLDQVLSNVAASAASASANEGGDDDSSQKLEWALQASQAVAALHSHQIVHADLQAKQFLVSAKGIIKLNDFNRCRFLPIQVHANGNATSICPIQIPSAPGISRSPEEYSRQELTEKLDVYSLGNVLFQILTNGLAPWFGEREQTGNTARIKAAIQRGEKPEIPSNILQGTTQQKALAVLVHFCYTRDPIKRIAANDLVRELQSLIRLRRVVDDI